jgi:hypothetical protein
MKRIAKKSLSVLLAVILASTLFVTAFATDEVTGGIEFFSADIDYQTNGLNYFYFAVTGYSIPNEENFACSIYDSQQNEVFNETMGDISFMTPDMMDTDTLKSLAPEDETEFVLVDVVVFDTVTMNPDETYTLVVGEGSLSNAQQEQCPELTYEFLPSDYIYVPTIWDKILYVLHSNPIFEFIFARLIVLIELFYYSPFGSWFPVIPMFG